MNIENTRLQKNHKNLKSFLKDKTNQKIFLPIFAFIFWALIGIVIGSKENYSMRKSFCYVLLYVYPYY